MKRKSYKEAAFTLVEMLAVVAIAGLIIAAVAPMLFSTLFATKLTSAGDSVLSQISLARQLAVSRNRVLELRLYSFADPGAAGEELEVKAVVVVEPPNSIAAAGAGGGGNNNATALTEVYYLPSGISIARTANLSPLFVKGTPQQDREQFIRKARNAQYVAIVFYPDGSTSIPQTVPDATNAYITLADSRLINNAGASVPDNFYAIQIDPLTGRPRAYRPDS
jgi:uncharacterized protein (TIGR02596 family)